MRTLHQCAGVEGLGGRSSRDFRAEFGRIVSARLWDDDGLRNSGRKPDLYALRQHGTGGIGHGYGFRKAPEDVDFVIVSGAGRESRAVDIEAPVDVKMHGRGCRLMFQLLARMDVVKGRLHESPQERGHAETDLKLAHRFPLRYHPHADSAASFGSARSRLLISSSDKGRYLPICRSPIEIVPIFVRTSFSTFAPRASTMRRTWRLRPSVMVISKNVWRPPESRTRSTFAGRVLPSDNSTPRRRRSSWSSVSSADAFTRYVFG